MKVEVEKLVTLECLGALELVPLGYVGALESRHCLGVFVACGICWEPPIMLWSVTQPCSSRSFGGSQDLLGASNQVVEIAQPSTGSVTTLKCPIVACGTLDWWGHKGDTVCH